MRDVRLTPSSLRGPRSYLVMILNTRFQLPRLVIAPYQRSAFSTIFPAITVLQTIMSEWETNIFRSVDPNNKNAYQSVTVLPPGPFNPHAIVIDSPSWSISLATSPGPSAPQSVIYPELCPWLWLRSSFYVIHSRKPHPSDRLCVGSPYINYACSLCVLRHAFAFPHTARRGKNLLSQGPVARRRLL